MTTVLIIDRYPVSRRRGRLLEVLPCGRDQRAMKSAFDLWAYDDVKEQVAIF